MPKFNDNPQYYAMVERLTKALEGVDQRLLELSDAPTAQYPLVLRLGSSRSGSTLFTQWAAATGLFAFPTNVMALFQKNPIFGACIQALMTDRRFRLNGEFDDLYDGHNSNSISGKTQGAGSPNEFWGFWLNYFSFPRTPISAVDWSNSSDFESFNRDVDALVAILGRPFLLKGHNLTHYVCEFAKPVPNAVYVHMYRDPRDVIVSVLKARVTRYGDPDYFFGWRPPEYEQLLSCDRVRQVAGQVYFNERALIESTPALGDRCILISYDRLCEQPGQIFSHVRDLVTRHSAGVVPTDYRAPGFYKCSTAASSERAEAAEGLRYWTSKHGPLVYADGSSWG